MKTLFKKFAAFSFISATLSAVVLWGGGKLKADDLAIAVGPEVDPATTFMTFGKAFDALMPGETLSFINAEGNIVADITLPSEDRYRLPKFKRKYAMSDILAVRTYLADENAAGKNADYLAILSTVGKLRTSESRPLHALILGGGLHIDERDPVISMLDKTGKIQIPSDGFLSGSLLLSSYGRSAKDKSALKGVNLHICPALPDLNTYEEERLGRFWVHYIRQRGGSLVTFEDDPKLCAPRFQKRLDKALAASPLDPKAKPVMERVHQNGAVEQVTRSERADAKQIRDEELDACRQSVAELEKDLSFYRSKSERQDKELAKMHSILDSARKLDGVTSFSRFQNVAHTVRSKLEVITGISYNTDAFPAYESAWCYMNLRGTYGGTVQVMIGDQKPGKPVQWADVSDRLLASVKLSRDDYNAARLSCRLPGEQA